MGNVTDYELNELEFRVKDLEMNEENFEKDLCNLDNSHKILEDTVERLEIELRFISDKLKRAQAIIDYLISSKNLYEVQVGSGLSPKLYYVEGESEKEAEWYVRNNYEVNKDDKLYVSKVGGLNG